MKPTLSALTVIAACAVITVGIWALFNKPSQEPPWPDRLMGLAYAPYQADQDGTRGEYPTPEQIRSDLALLSGKTHPTAPRVR